MWSQIMKIQYVRCAMSHVAPYNVVYRFSDDHRQMFFTNLNLVPYVDPKVFAL